MIYIPTWLCRDFQQTFTEKVTAIIRDDIVAQFVSACGFFFSFSRFSHFSNDAARPFNIAYPDIGPGSTGYMDHI